LNIQTNTDLRQNTIYQQQIWNYVDGGETGLLLTHGATVTTQAQWGISCHRTTSNSGELIFRTRTASAENKNRLVIDNSGNLIPGADSSQDFGTSAKRWQNSYVDIGIFTDSVRIADGSANKEADIHFRGGGTGNSGGKNFRIGSNIGGGIDTWSIYASETNGSSDWKSLASPAQAPALSIQGTNNRVAINTTQFSGTDNTDPNNPENRNYILNVQGDMNLNGILYQDNAEFVTSRWTEAATTNINANIKDIYRLSAVGINNSSPTYALDVDGDINLTGAFRVGGTAQWIDSAGIIRVSNTVISENVTIPGSTIASSQGPITITNTFTVVINSGAEWSIN
jgi:hypothetical protein